MAKSIIFRPIKSDGDKNDKMDSSGDEDNKPRKRKKPGFFPPGERVNEKDKEHS